MGKRPALIVFARAPVAGQAKTRLIPALGPERAAELYRCFLLDTIELVRGAPADVLVAVAERQHLDSVRSLVRDACPEAEVAVQRGGDLGERIVNALEETVGSDRSHAVVIGTDSPTLPLQRVCEALALSRERDLVLGPCYDGGYYLVGVHAVRHEFFRGIAWSSNTVLVETVRRARESGAEVGLLDPWYDVDTPRDLEVLRLHLTARSLAGETIRCWRTWECLRRLGEEAGT